MSYNLIYGIGKSPQQALIYAKVNEIGHETNTRFLKKTKVKCLDFNKDKLEIYLFMVYNIKNIDRELTTSELNANNELTKYYGKKELKNIIDIYSSLNTDISLCFIDSKYEDYNLYKFLY